MTPIYFADETQLRFRSDDRDRSQCRERLPNANGSRHRYIIQRGSSFTSSVNKTIDRTFNCRDGA